MTDRLLRLTDPMMRGQDVRAVQVLLRNAGHDAGEPDGIYGPATRDAVTAFQRAGGLRVDGVVGPVTRAQILAAGSSPPLIENGLTDRDRERLAGVHPDLVRVVALARRRCHFMVVEGVRGLERQRELYLAGKSTTMRSRHLPGPDGFGRAVDLAPWHDDGDGRVEHGELRWTRAEMEPVVAAMRQAAAELGVAVVHGHSWGWDSPHHELDRRRYP
jgi:peptidoglycan LD-endopeptidase CwlK